MTMAQFKNSGLTGIQIVMICIIGLSFSGCQTVPETGRSAVHLVPESQLDAMSVQAFNEMKREVPVSKDAQKNAMLKRVGTHVVKAARQRGADLPPPEQWEFVVFDDDAINAFAMPGGKVGFYIGIFKMFDNDADCAVVMGHEVAHVAADHGNERVSQQLLASAVGQASAIGLSQTEMSSGMQSIAMGAVGLGTQVGVLLPFSRIQESEADHIGLKYMASAKAICPLHEFSKPMLFRFTQYLFKSNNK